MQPMSNAKYTERLSVGFTPDQVRRLDEIARVRSRKGDPLSKADVVRSAVEFYLMNQEDLPGSRKAIAKAVEGRIADVDTKVDDLRTMLRDFIVYVKTPKDRR
jgi:hypothetical protein